MAAGGQHAAISASGMPREPVQEGISAATAAEIESLLGGAEIGGSHPKAIEDWCYDGGSEEMRENEKQHQHTFKWLKAALRLAHKHPGVKYFVKELLQASSFTGSMEYMEIFDPLQAFCRGRLLAISQPLQAYYRGNDAVRGLADLYPDTLAGLISQERLRQDDPLVGLHSPASFDMTTFQGESRYIHFRRLIALVLNRPYQDMVQKASSQGKHKACNIKSDARMRNKCLAPDDHRYLAKPRPAHNIDILRCCVTFPDVSSMRGGIKALVALARKGTGGVGRVKNGFALSEEDAAKSFHYRCWMMNMVVDFGQTLGEMLATPESAELMDKYVNAPPENMGHSWGSWRRDALAALEALRSEEVSKRRAVMVCEVQVLLDPYLEARKEMHLLYKIVRAVSDEHLMMEFAVQTQRWDSASWFAAEQCQVDEAKRETLEYSCEYALFNACYDGFVKAVEIALKVDWVDVNQAVQERGGCTPLLIACQCGHVDAVRMLLSTNGLDVNQADEDGCAPLYVACRNDRLRVVRLMLSKDGVDVNQATGDGSTPLWIACERGHVDVVRVMLSEDRVDVNQPDEDGCTPLSIACEKGHVDVVGVMLSKDGVDVNQANGDGCTPLSIACEKGHVDVVRLLLSEDGVDVIVASSSVKNPINSFLESLGYQETETKFGKVL